MTNRFSLFLLNFSLAFNDDKGIFSKIQVEIHFFQSHSSEIHFFLN